MNYTYNAIKVIFTKAFLLVTITSLAQNDHTSWLTPRYTIGLSTNQGNKLKGILAGVADSSVTIYPGRFSEWNRHSTGLEVTTWYREITAIKTHKKGGLLRGVLIGAGVGLAPVLIGSIFGRGAAEGGAYASIIAFPLATITGGIIGSTSRRRFLVNGESSRFVSFLKKHKPR